MDTIGSCCAQAGPRWNQAAAAAPRRADRWLVSSGADPVNVTERLPDPPAHLRRSADGEFFAMADGSLLVFPRGGTASGPFLPCASR